MPTIKSNRTRERPTAQEDKETPGDGAGTSAPGDHSNDRTQSYADDRLDCIASRRKHCGLRTADNHASWRDVYRACHVTHG